MDFPKLHPTQERLLRALMDNQGNLPSLRVLAKKIGLRSPNTIAHHLEQLQRKGYLVVHESGEIEVNARPLQDIVYLPLYGSAAAGQTEFFAEGNVEEWIPLPTRQLRVAANHFLVRARGNSMEPRIHDGDLLLVQPRQELLDGQIMVITSEDGPVVKRVFKQDDNRLLLQSLNEKYPPIVLTADKRPQVLGIVRGILRTKIN